MTTSNGQPPDFPSRLDRIEALVATNSEQIAANISAIGRLEVSVTANTVAITRLEANQAAMSERVNIMAERVDTLAESIRLLVPIIQSIQSDVRGLQLENRRILDILQQRGENG
ncbi:hypothetical protein [Gloeobacter violaceus]|uniref:Gll2635 protein n=1 Tax=Gloeobacter violaceus (strain ATCC 29082 / PCC 7421) TaxID=251221 RepID=Q7NHA2_GLOVI|nr:hypothetical protein [Gloeobacter violaceus]BAC90576.1 gll2635 [Gloeobacter violaceus PCC 7421]